ncbi:MAG: N-acetyltransferase family protein [Bacteroidota bacterium]
MTIRPLLPSDWPKVESIYLEGIATNNATFETSSPGWARWDKSHLPACRFVAEIDGEIAGWVAISPVSDRCVYGGVGETSIYIGNRFQGRGLATALMKKVIKASEDEGLWTLMAATFPENEPSIKLHQKVGFRIIGVREKIGKHYGKWRDTVLMERRSEVIW